MCWSVRRSLSTVSRKFAAGVQSRERKTSMWCLLLHLRGEWFSGMKILRFRCDKTTKTLTFFVILLQEPCEWKCEHETCTKVCGDLCDRKPCDEECPLPLSECGHPCSGFCGEPCPPFCNICDGKENIPDSTRYFDEQCVKNWTDFVSFMVLYVDLVSVVCSTIDSSCWKTVDVWSNLTRWKIIWRVENDMSQCIRVLNARNSSWTQCGTWIT